MRKISVGLMALALITAGLSVGSMARGEKAEWIMIPAATSIFFLVVRYGVDLARRET